MSQSDTEQLDTTKETTEQTAIEEPKITHIWERQAMLEGDEVTNAAKVLEQEDETLAPSTTMLAEFMNIIQNKDMSKKKKRTKTLPHKNQNYWDQKTETLLCYDLEKQIAELWKRVEETQ